MSYGWATHYPRGITSPTTPTLARRRTAATLADVDLDGIRRQMAATIERAKETDPAELRRRLAALQAEVAAAKAAVSSASGIDPEALAAAIMAAERALGERVATLERDLVARLRSGLEPFVAMVAEGFAAYQRMLAEAFAQLPSAPVPRSGVLPSFHRPEPRELLPLARQRTRGRAYEGLTGPSATQHRILDMIASLEVRGLAPDRDRVARWLGLHPNGGRYNHDLAALREDGWLDGFVLTAKARAREGTPMPTGLAAMRKHVGGHRDGATRLRILDVVGKDGPFAGREALAEALGLHPNGGRFNHDLAWLRTMGLLPARGQIAATEAWFR